MKLLKVVISFLALVSLQIAATQWLHVPPPVQARGLMMLGGGVPVAGGSFTGLFYSDFETQADDDKWSLGAGSNADYTTGPLEGIESLYSEGVENDTFSTAWTNDTTGTVYARIAFKTLVGSYTGDYQYLSLYGDGTSNAGCGLIYDDGGFYRIYAFNSGWVDNVWAAPTANEFNDAKYWLYLTYVRGASITCEVKNSAGVLVTGWSATIETAESGVVDQVLIETHNGSYLFDQVEVRKDTDWGN